MVIANLAALVRTKGFCFNSKMCCNDFAISEKMLQQFLMSMCITYISIFGERLQTDSSLIWTRIKLVRAPEVRVAHILTKL